MSFDRSAVPLAALDFMNRDHQDFMDAVEALEYLLQQATPDMAAVTHSLGEILEHTRTHFAAEEREMAETGFPPFPVHQREHARVLAEMTQQAGDWQARHDAAALLRYVQEIIPAWLTQHTQTMDFVTANWVAAHKRSGA